MVTSSPISPAYTEMRKLENVLWNSYEDRVPYRRPVFALGQATQFARKLARGLKALGLTVEALHAEKVPATRIWHLPPRFIESVTDASLCPTLPVLHTLKSDTLEYVINEMQGELSGDGWTPAAERLLKSFFGERCFGPWAFSRPISRSGAFDFFKAELACMLAYRASMLSFEGSELRLTVSDVDGVSQTLLVNNSEALKHIKTSPGQSVTDYATSYERADAWLRRNKPQLSAKLSPALAMLRLYTPLSTLNVFETALQQVDTEGRVYVPPAARFDEQVLDDLRLLWAAAKPLPERYLDLWHACVPEIMDDTTWVAIFGQAGHYSPAKTSERMMNYRFQMFVAWYLNQLRVEKRRNGS